MPDYLSSEWFDAAGRALRADPGLRAASAGVHLVLQQTVEDPDDPVTWHVRMHDGEVDLLVGPAPAPTVTFRCDRATASGVHRGELSAQGAFMAGQLRVGGDTRALLAHQALLTGLDDVLGTLRGGTG